MKHTFLSLTAQEKIMLHEANHQPAFPLEGFVRLSQILAPAGPIPVSRSTWWQGVKDGRYPKPVKLGPRVTVWRAADIRALFETGAA